MKELSNLDLAIELYNQKKYQMAKLEFLKVAEFGLDWEIVEANLYLGKIALRSEKELLFDAINYMEYVISRGNIRQREQAYFEMATKYRLLKDYEKATNLYRKCLEYYPNDVFVIGDLANLYLKLKNLDAAYILYNRLLEINANRKSVENKITNANIAYLGLAKIALRRGNISEVKKYLERVNPKSANDKEQKDEILSNLNFYYENYPKARTLLESNLNSRLDFVRKYSKEKEAILFALENNNEESIKILEAMQKRVPLTKGGSLTLASLYYQKKDYMLAYKIYRSIGYNEQEYLVNALECAMHFDEILAIKIINLLLLTNIDYTKYRTYLLYLSKKYNIFFVGTNYDNILPIEEEIMQYDAKKVLTSAETNCQINYREGYNWDYIVNGIIKNSLKNHINLDNVYYKAGSIYDTYIIYVPFIAWDYRDYLVVKTYKDSKIPIEITVKSKEELEQATAKNLLKHDDNIRKLFR